MKAARLYQTGTPLKVEEIPDPTLKPAGAIIKVLGAHMPSFTNSVISGELGYALPEFPFTLGPSAIGVVEEVADDVFGLEVGQRVFCDPQISSHTIGAESDRILIAWTGLDAASARTQHLWKDGTFAEKVLWPAEALTPLGSAQSLDPALLAASLNYLTIAYGGLLRGELRPSQTLIVNGATGGLGAAAVLVALAMGAAKIVAAGRNQAALETIVQLDPKRVKSVALSGNFSDDSKQLGMAAGGADMVIDLLGGVNNPEPTLACINALRPRGTAIFVGGVKAEIPLPYSKIMLAELTIRGSFMYPRHAPGDLLRLIEAGTLDLSAIGLHKFGLYNINEAIASAAKLKGLEYCVVVPASESAY